ncbi:unnamed protein product [Lupinus luteus]|uniref:Tetraspanin-11 n=1 Tax=Lupinus luteus TaxID=3873 RepID=A0AAV1XXT6_LUPLU
MIRISNTLVGALNILSLLIGLVAVGTSAYIHVHGGASTNCQRVLQYPLLFGGVFVVLVSTLAIVGSMCRVNVALYMYLFVTFLLIVWLVLFTIFALFVTNRKVGQNVSGNGEYKSGCCKPPAYCGYTMKNATFWEVPKTGPPANNSDCAIWSNKQDKLCYDCNSCKGGVLANIRNQWKHLTVFNACVLILVTAIYVLGCYAIRNNRLDSLGKHPRAPNP